MTGTQLFYSKDVLTSQEEDEEEEVEEESYMKLLAQSFCNHKCNY